jgi:F-type H+-transporting ATPase subunit epsilon
VATLRVEIVTPEGALWAGDARALKARSTVGLFTVLAQHTATVGDLVPGIIRVDTDEGELAFVVHGGYFQVRPGDDAGATLVTVLAGVAEPLGDVDVARAQLAQQRADATLAESPSDPDDDETHSEARADLARAGLRLSAASRATQRPDT